MGSSSSKRGGFSGPTQPDPAIEEYERRKKELSEQRAKDLTSMKSRLAAGGVSEQSVGWETGLQTIISSYDKKLEQLGADPFFKGVTKSGY